MSYRVGEIVDSRFIVNGLCNDSGGMGQILFVTDILKQFSETLVLKYCREESEDYKNRFRREVRLLEEFDGNSKVVEILYSNTDYQLPYFVMKYYHSGDLTSLFKSIIHDPIQQERIFNQMIDCIAELHSKNIYHRDIKPQNFLLNEPHIVVSDFGLSMEVDSLTRITSSSILAGTTGYIPPEFESGGFKYPGKTSDIFMLGKSFYVLLTNQNPTHLMENNIHPAVFQVIKRSCELEKEHRYQTLIELKQALKLAYDVIIGRGSTLSEVNKLAKIIDDGISKSYQHVPSQVVEFIVKLLVVDDSDKIQICMELHSDFMMIISQDELIPHLPNFLQSYSVMAESSDYAFQFTEVIAKNMRQIFNSIDVGNQMKTEALSIAINAAQKNHRFDAMNICNEMIASISDDELGILVADIIDRNPHDFLFNNGVVRYKSQIIKIRLESLKDAEIERKNAVKQSMQRFKGVMRKL